MESGSSSAPPARPHPDSTQQPSGVGEIPQQAGKTQAVTDLLSAEHRACVFWLEPPDPHHFVGVGDLPYFPHAPTDADVKRLVGKAVAGVVDAEQVEPVGGVTRLLAQLAGRGSGPVVAGV